MSLVSHKFSICVDLHLTRVPTDAEPLPEEFRVSVAIADDLLDPVVVSSATANLSEQTMENGSISEVNEDTSHLVSLHRNVERSSFVNLCALISIARQSARPHINIILSGTNS